MVRAAGITKRTPARERAVPADDQPLGAVRVQEGLLLEGERVVGIVVVGVVADLDLGSVTSGFRKTTRS